MVKGNTDGVGSSESNRELSFRRAQAVRDYLITRQNLNPKRVIAVGNGSEHPVASNDTPEGRMRNRRTEIKIVVDRSDREGDGRGP